MWNFHLWYLIHLSLLKETQGVIQECIKHAKQNFEAKDGGVTRRSRGFADLVGYVISLHLLTWLSGSTIVSRQLENQMQKRVTGTVASKVTRLLEGSLCNSHLWDFSKWSGNPSFVFVASKLDLGCLDTFSWSMLSSGTCVGLITLVCNRNIYAYGVR